MGIDPRERRRRRPMLMHIYLHSNVPYLIAGFPDTMVQHLAMLYGIDTVIKSIRVLRPWNTNEIKRMKI